MEAPREIARTLCHGVHVLRFEYQSPALGGTTTRFHALVPPAAAAFPVLYFLSGLTSTDENCAQKGGACPPLAAHNIIMILPDTSPRGAGAPGEDDNWAFGTGAGFYVDAITPGFEAYQMYSFIVDELPQAVSMALGDRVDIGNAGITGHSMGGHGALVIGMRNTGKYKSVSAFAPIANPVAVPWGHTCFKGYLGDDESKWKEWDATEIVRAKGGPVFDSFLIDQGTEDEFLERELHPQVFKEACESVGQKLTLRFQEGYSHAYYFINTFMADHVQYHSEILHNRK